MLSIYDRKSNFARILSYYGRLFKGFDMRLHTHNSCEIMYVVEGEAVIQVAGQDIVLGKNQFIFLDQNVPHLLQVPGQDNAPILCLEFACRPEVEGLDLGKIERNSRAFAAFRDLKKPYVVLHDNDNLGVAMKDFIKELDKKDGAMDYLRELLFARVLIELARCAENSGIKGISYINKAKKYISEHFCGPLTVEQIAAVAGINSAYLQTLFHQYEGCSILQMVNGMRIEKSKFLLRNSQLDIMDIAVEAGFNSRQHFAYIFNKYTHLSPKQYRKLAGQNAAFEYGQNQ